jgi:hypothetical protein
MSQKIWNFFNQNIISVVISSILVVTLPLIILRQPAEGKAEYIIVKTNGLVNVADSDIKNLKLIFKEKPVENLSQTDIQIFNKSGKPFRDVKITFELKPGIDGKIPILVSRSLVGPEGYSSEGIKLNKETKGKITYTVDWINNSKNPFEVLNKDFKARFIVAGKIAPEIKISASAEGLEIVSYDVNLMFWELFKLLLIPFLVYILGIVALGCYSRKLRSRKVQGLVRELIKISKDKDSSSLSSDQIQKVVEKALDIKFKKTE